LDKSKVLEVVPGKLNKAIGRYIWLNMHNKFKNNKIEFNSDMAEKICLGYARIPAELQRIKS